MDEALTKLNAGSLLAALEDARHITPQVKQKLGNDIRAKETDIDLPNYLHVLAGIGAFIATLCLIGFLAITKVITLESIGAIGWGGLFVACGVVVARRARGLGIGLQSFLMQMSFCLVGTGKILAIAGAMSMAKNDYFRSDDAAWYMTFVLGGVTALAWPFYDVFLDRLLSSVATLAALTVAVLGNGHDAGMREFLLDGLLVAELCAAAAVFTTRRAGRTLAPLGYALLAGITMIVGMFSLHGHDFVPQTEVFSPAVANIALSAALIGLIGWAAGDLARLSREPLMVASLGAAALGLISAPGVTLGIGVMILGYARLERRLVAFGGALMAGFLWIYYYSLNMNLFEKSGVLVASGLLLLAGNAYLRYRKLDKEA
jgi:hypothetical protein